MANMMRVSPSSDSQWGGVALTVVVEGRATAARQRKEGRTLLNREREPPPRICLRQSSRAKRAKFKRVM
jgi:hypothetical protein